MRQFAIIILIVLLIPLPLSSTPVVTIEEGTPFGITPADLNGNGIDDLLDQSRYEEITAIVHIDDTSNLPSILDNYRIEYVFEQIDAVKIETTKSHLQRLIDSPEVNYIEYNHKIDPLLLESTEQMGLIDSFWANSLIGGDSMSVAVIDSGIDATHSAFEGRIIASYNAMDENATAPVDNDGHGTHVTGIAAGYLNLTNDVYRESSPSVFGGDCTNQGCYVGLDFQLTDISQGQEVSFVVDWGEPGIDNPGSTVGVAILNPITGDLACNDCQLEDNDGYIQDSVTLSAGSYIFGTYSAVGAAEEPYEAAVSYTKPDLANRDVKGVAHGANIVSVKVLDSLEGGELDVFDRAITWLIDNRMTYNISVVNLSLGLSVYSSSLDALMRNLVDAGILPVVAAGNGGQDSGGVFSPASAPEALTVGSINNIGEVTYYTNIGSSNINDIATKPDVLAPGGSIASNLLGFETGYETGVGLISAPAANIGYNIFEDDLVGYQGTSMAAPHIAGLAVILASQLHQDVGWDWNSRANVMEIKRMIQAGTYEVGNIGEGREQILGDAIAGPPVNRNAKDFQEGWGAVSASSVYGLFETSIDVGYSETLNFNLDDPFSTKSYGYSMTLQPNTNYGFTTTVPSTADVDLKIIRADTGPLVDGEDVGELQILEASTSGVGEDEGIAINVDTTTEVFIVATIINGNGDVSSNFNVIELTELPSVEIQSPFDGQELENPITVEFTSSQTTVDLFIDGEFVESIQSGEVLDNLSEGSHTMTLRAKQSGISVSDSVSFTVLESEEEESDDFLNFSSFLVVYSSLFVMVVLVSRRFNKFHN